MIFDTLPYLSQYLPPNVGEILTPFCNTLRPGMPKGEIILHKPDVFARISSYNTVPLHEGRFEAHKRYVDVQILLTGSEIIEVFPVSMLFPNTDYDKQNDVQFYNPTEHKSVRLTMTPGSFALFFPQDAHCPGLTPTFESQYVEKVVVKIEASLLHGRRRS